MGKAPITTPLPCNHHHPKNEQTNEQDQKKIKTKTKNREAFPRLSVQRRSWAGQATDPPSHWGPLRISKQQTRAHLRPTPRCLLAPPLRHTATVVDFSALGPFIPGSTFCFLGGIRVIREGHSFASGQKASSYGMGTLPRFSFCFFCEKLGISGRPEWAPFFGGGPRGEDRPSPAVFFFSCAALDEEAPAFLGAGSPCHPICSWLVH
ncbi:hypothetical protein J3E69DRAFT_347939 [Trichoderma sp. SZMC 28015]